MMTSALEAAASADQENDDEEGEDPRSRTRWTNADARDHLVAAPAGVGHRSVTDDGG